MAAEGHSRLRPPEENNGRGRRPRKTVLYQNPGRGRCLRNMLAEHARRLRILKENNSRRRCLRKTPAEDPWKTAAEDDHKEFFLYELL